MANGNRAPILTLLVVLLYTLSTFAPAQTRPATSQSSGKDRPRGEAPDKASTTEHELKTADGVLHYRATAGYMPMKEESGKLRANFFFVAYERRDGSRPEQRPITFVFNGGPGAAAVWLHLGTAGPRKIALTETGLPGRPPYRLAENPDTWLGATDLVFVDPAGTGYSRVAEGVKGEEFYGVQQDIDSISEFIRLYLTRNNRWDSPKFIAGESYGTTRGALLAEHLLERYGIALSGVALISTVLNFQTISPSAGNDLPYALFLPTYTATAFYHKKLAPDLQNELKTTLSQVERWVNQSYAPALMRGTALVPDERRTIVSDMARFTGLDSSFIEKNNLRVAPAEFMQQLLSSQRKLIGRFDGRITGDVLDPAANHAEFDPSLSLYLNVYTQTMNSYARRSLKFESDLTYEVLSGRVHPWNWGKAANGGWLFVADNLRRAMAKNPHLKVMFASGFYDLATPYFATDYTVNHLDLPPELLKNIRQTYYPGGHMMYHDQSSLKKLNDDFREFVKWAAH